jgi:hypothetical protein
MTLPERHDASTLHRWGSTPVGSCRTGSVMGETIAKVVAIGSLGRRLMALVQQRSSSRQAGEVQTVQASPANPNE